MCKGPGVRENTVHVRAGKQGEKLLPHGVGVVTVRKKEKPDGSGRALHTIHHLKTG